MKKPNAIISSDFGPIIINLYDTGVGKDIVDHGFWAHGRIALMKTLFDKQLEKKQQ
jgi:hypothetical protein